MDRRKFVFGITSALAMPAIASEAKAASKRSSVGVIKDRIVSAQRSYSYSVVQDPTGAGLARSVERFEIRGGDCSTSGDCTPRALLSPLKFRTAPPGLSAR
jgi:hypothetical protein